MNCTIFEERLSEYLEGAVDRRLRSSLASHLIECLECRRLYDDVRITTKLCGALPETMVPENLQDRILAATAAGEMMSCSVFDNLISDYFDGYVSASDHQVFQSHFEQCPRCSRLLETIRLARELCKGIRQVEVPEDLSDRILAKTSALTGERRARSKIPRTGAGGAIWIHVRRFSVRTLRMIAAPESAAASILLLATLGFLLFNFSEDHSLQGILRHAELRWAQLVHRTGVVTADKEWFGSDLRQVQFQVNAAIGLGTSLFGRSRSPAKESTRKPQTSAPSRTTESDLSNNPPKKEQLRSGLE